MPYPTASDYTFDEGIDPTATFGVYTSVLLQLIRQALPNSERGLIIYRTTTPSVTGAYAWQKRCIWIKTGAGSDQWHAFLYNDTLASWIDLTQALGVGAINNPAQITDGIIPLSKLNISAIARQLLQVNATGNALELKNLDQVITDGIMSLDINYGSQYFLTRGSPALWQGVNPAAFKAASIPLSKLLHSGTSGQVLTVVPVGITTQLAFANPASGAPSGAAGGSLSGTYPNPVIANSGVTPTTYGSTNAIPVITIGPDGRITAATTAPSTTTFAKIVYQENQGIQGTFDTVNKVFKLNQKPFDAFGLVNSLTSNEFELVPGTYELWFSSSPHYSGAYPDAAILLLYNVTATSVSDYITVSWRAANELANINFVSYVTVAALTKFRYQYEAASDFDFEPDQAANQAGRVERYSQLIIRKIG